MYGWKETTFGEFVYLALEELARQGFGSVAVELVLKILAGVEPLVEELKHHWAVNRKFQLSSRILDEKPIDCLFEIVR